MRKDKLVIIDDNLIFRVQWEIASDDGYNDLGAVLGEDSPFKYTEERLKKCDPEDWENNKANIVARKTRKVKRDGKGFYWESKLDAQMALKEIKIALKNKSDKPMEDWEIKALAAGWKPPKSK